MARVGHHRGKGIGIARRAVGRRIDPFAVARIKGGAAVGRLHADCAGKAVAHVGIADREGARDDTIFVDAHGRTINERRIVIGGDGQRDSSRVGEMARIAHHHGEGIGIVCSVVGGRINPLTSGRMDVGTAIGGPHTDRVGESVARIRITDREGAGDDRVLIQAGRGVLSHRRVIHGRYGHADGGRVGQAAAIADGVGKGIASTKVQRGRIDRRRRATDADRAARGRTHGDHRQTVARVRVAVIGQHVDGDSGILVRVPRVILCHRRDIEGHGDAGGGGQTAGVLDSIGKDVDSEGLGWGVGYVRVMVIDGATDDRAHG